MKFCILFLLMFYVLVNNISVMSRQFPVFQVLGEVFYLDQGPNTVPLVSPKLGALRSHVYT